MSGRIFVLEGHGYQWNGDSYEVHSIDRHIPEFEVGADISATLCAVELMYVLKGDDRYKKPCLPEVNFYHERGVGWLVHVPSILFDLR